MRPAKWLILLCFFVISCGEKSKDTPKKQTPAKVLDTSFLKLGKVGIPKYKADIPSNGHIHILDDSQNITLVDASKGKIKISNFDLEELSDQDVIIGNEKDQNLFVYHAGYNNGDEIRVTQGSVQDIVREEKATIELEFTPQMVYEPSEARTFEKLADRNPSQGPENQIKNPEKTKINVIDFKDYQLLDITANNLLAGTNLKTGKKTEINLHQGKDLKVTLDRGFLQIIPTFRGNYVFEGLGKYNFKSSFDAMVKYEFEVTVETKSATMGEVSLPLFKELKFPFKIPGPVPVYTEMNLQFPAGIKVGTAKEGKVSFRVQAEYALNAVTYFDSKTGKKIDSHYDYVVKNRNVEEVKSNSNFIFEIFFEPRLETKFYKVLGPYAYVNTNMQANIKSPLKEKDEDIFVNFSGGVGVTLSTPIFNKTLVDVQSPTLFKYTQGWDVIGPDTGKGPKYEISLQKEIQLTATKLDGEKRIALNLRPDNMGPLGKVRIYDTPKFGRLAKSKNFDSSGIAFYYPPKVIEGRDSFLIQMVEHGLESPPSRVTINFSQEAKDQAASDQLPSLPSYDKSLKEQAKVSEVIGLPEGVYSFKDLNEARVERQRDTGPDHQGSVDREILPRYVSLTLPDIKVIKADPCSKEEPLYLKTNIVASNVDEPSVSVSLLDKDKNPIYRDDILYTLQTNLVTELRYILMDYTSFAGDGVAAFFSSLKELQEYLIDEKGEQMYLVLPGLLKEENNFIFESEYSPGQKLNEKENEYFHSGIANITRLTDAISLKVDEIQRAEELKPRICKQDISLAPIEIKFSHVCSHEKRFFLHTDMKLAPSEESNTTDVGTLSEEGLVSVSFKTYLKDEQGLEYSDELVNKLRLDLEVLNNVRSVLRFDNNFLLSHFETIIRFPYILRDQYMGKPSSYRLGFTPNDIYHLDEKAALRIRARIQMRDARYIYNGEKRGIPYKKAMRKAEEFENLFKFFSSREVIENSWCKEATPAGN